MPIEQKFVVLERRQQETNQKIGHLEIQAAGVEEKEGRVEKAFELLEDDFKDIGDEVNEVQMTVENLDNVLRRNDLRLKGLKEGAEGDNLVSFLDASFVACLGSD